MKGFFYAIGILALLSQGGNVAVLYGLKKRKTANVTGNILFASTICNMAKGIVQMLHMFLSSGYDLDLGTLGSVLSGATFAGSLANYILIFWIMLYRSPIKPPSMLSMKKVRFVRCVAALLILLAVLVAVLLRILLHFGDCNDNGVRVQVIFTAIRAVPCISTLMTSIYVLVKAKKTCNKSNRVSDCADDIETKATNARKISTVPSVFSVTENGREINGNEQNQSDTVSTTATISLASWSIISSVLGLLEITTLIISQFSQVITQKSYLMHVAFVASAVGNISQPVVILSIQSFLRKDAIGFAWSESDKPKDRIQESDENDQRMQDLQSPVGFVEFFEHLIRRRRSDISLWSEIGLGIPELLKRTTSVSPISTPGNECLREDPSSCQNDGHVEMPSVSNTVKDDSEIASNLHKASQEIPPNTFVSRENQSRARGAVGDSATNGDILEGTGTNSTIPGRERIAWADRRKKRVPVDTPILPRT